MARIRTIKPDFFSSDDVAALPIPVRLMWIGLWTYVDDHGRGKDNVRLIKAHCWPLDDEMHDSDVEKQLVTLGDCGRILRYVHEDLRYFVIMNWHKHQSINRVSLPKCPPPNAYVGTPGPGEQGHCETCFREDSRSTHVVLTDGPRSTHGVLTEEKPVDNSITPDESTSPSTKGLLTEGSVTTHGAVTERSRQERKGRERKGITGGASSDYRKERENDLGQRPPKDLEQKCAKHKNLPPGQDPGPCGACRTARLAAKAEVAEQRERLGVQANQRRNAIAKCGLCDDEGWLMNDEGEPVTPATRCKHEKRS